MQVKATVTESKVVSVSVDPAEILSRVVHDYFKTSGIPFIRPADGKLCIEVEEHTSHTFWSTHVLRDSTPLDVEVLAAHATLQALCKARRAS